MTSPTESPQVLIAGAGPTGLSLAITCRRHGLSVRIIDRAPHPSEVSKALAVWSGSLEAFEAMGVVDAFLAAGTRMKALIVGDGRHELGRVAVGEGVDSPYPFPILLPQSKTEHLLAQRLAELGTTVEWGVELTALEQDPSGVTATLRAADGTESSCRAAYLVGCDGARSTVRHALNVAFDGYTEPQTFLLCDARIEGSIDPTAIYVWWHGGGTVALFPVERNVWRVIAIREDGDDSSPPTAEEMQHQLDQHGPVGLRLYDPTWLSTFRINERLAASYRGGRCFLAGDAAHIHSPAGGQGMNTGIQDAVNLGWKLALALKGVDDPEVLLDSYEAERRPVAREVVQGAAQRLHVGFGDTTLQRVLKDIAIPIFTRIPAVQRKLQVDLSETEIIYHDGPLVALGGAESSRKRPCVGGRALDSRLYGDVVGPTQRLWPLICHAGHTLLWFGASARLNGQSTLFQALGDRLNVVHLDAKLDPAGEVRARYGIHARGWVLIRPDQVIAARSEDDDLTAFEQYVARVLRPSPA